MRLRGLLSEISICFAVLRYDVVRMADVGARERADGHSLARCACGVFKSRSDTAEGAIAAAGALIVPSPQSCLRHRCGGVHQTSCITLACDRNMTTTILLLFGNMHSTDQIRAHTYLTRPLRYKLIFRVIQNRHMTSDDDMSVRHRFEKARLKYLRRSTLSGVEHAQ